MPARSGANALNVAPCLGFRCGEVVRGNRK
jgi:hypothetical protein